MREKMIQNREEEIRAAYDMFSAAWKFYLHHWEVSGEDAYWEPVVKEAEKMIKDGGSPLLRGLVNAVMEDMERRSKNEN